MTKQEKLQKLSELRNPELKTQKLLAAQATDIIEKGLMEGNKGETGEPGYTPIKGKDYYNESEINQIIYFIQSKITNGIDGKDGVGINGIDGIDGKDGRNGMTPIRSIDYWTIEDQKKIIKEVLANIPKPKDGITPNKEEIVNNVVDVLKNNPIHLKDIGGTKELIEFLKRGGFRGGGSSGGGTTIGFTGDLIDSNLIKIADVVNGLITSVVFTLTDFYLQENGVDYYLSEAGDVFIEE